MKQIWYYVLESLSWLFYCFFQPSRFRGEFESKGFFRLKRTVPMLRLTLTLWLLAYLPLLTMRSILSHNFFIDSLPTTAEITAVGLVLGMTGGLILGIVGSLALGIVGGLVLGTLCSLPWGLTGGLASGIAFAIMGGILFGLTEGNELSVAGFIAGGVALGMTKSITDAIIGAIALGLAGIITFIIRTSQEGGRFTWGFVLIGGSMVGFIVWFLGEAITQGFTGDFFDVVGGMVFLISYLIGYYRLPLYPVSALSTLRAYLISKKNRLHVFTYLHRSSLYWDERVFLPLPGLKRMLLLAAEQNIEQALEEIAFIAAERPQQIDAARLASLEIAIQDLETRDILKEIAQGAPRLAELLLQEVRLIDPRWVTPFARLSDASRDAALALSPLGWSARRNALQQMVASLKKVYPNTALPDARLNRRLGEVIKTWRAVAQRELEKLEQAPEKTSRIDNPYIPGQVLEHDNRLFVGRRDLARQLGESLSRTGQHPTFLLYGERRIGKSSTLKHLPVLLGERYLPIFCDLQSPKLYRNIASFLDNIAEEIYKVLGATGIPAQRPPSEQLQAANQRNDAEVYYHFERWFEKLERKLEQEDRTVLLTFDEFEKLEEVGQGGSLNLKLLLNWFRSVIQHHPRLALLFSSVRSFSDMDVSWAGYFVNVQTLKVSFLDEAEARQLITRPVSDFPAGYIFGEQVVEEIIRVTACHPFLVQAVCSVLLDSLNADKRDQIELLDVRTAVKQVLESWGHHFQDLLERSDKNQRACLVSLQDLGTGDLFTIEQRSGLQGTTLRHALEVLRDRDLVVLDDGLYRIAVPILSEWIENNKYRIQLAH